MDSLSAVTWNCSCRRVKEQSHKKRERERERERGEYDGETAERECVAEREGKNKHGEGKRVKSGPIKGRGSERGEERESPASQSWTADWEVKFVYLWQCPLKHTHTHPHTHTHTHSWSPLTLDNGQYTHTHTHTLSHTHTRSLSLLAYSFLSHCQPPHHIQLLHTHTHTHTQLAPLALKLHSARWTGA